jgi:GWxTD domain-containing protein
MVKISLQKISFLILILFVFQACKTKESLENKNLAFIYYGDKQKLNPQFAAFHKNDSLTHLIFQIQAEDLLYQKAYEEKNFISKGKVSVKIFNDNDRQKLLDSTSFLFSDEIEQVIDKTITQQHEIKVVKGGIYFLEINTTDLNANETHKSFLTIDKSQINSKNNFLVKNTDTNLPENKKYFKVGEDVTIASNIKSADSYFIKYYNQPITLPLPPFVVGSVFNTNFEPELIYQINKNQEYNDVFFKFDKPGIYHFQIDTAKNNDGLTLFCREDDYPKLNTINDLIEPLRYITGKKEFNDIKMASDPKKALDAFWLKNAGSNDRARRIIKAFYNRVKDCNNYFSTYTEGWKTDRGMIFLIYGTPSSVYIDKQEEIWTYGEDNSPNAISFLFTKKYHPLSDNEYVLERTINYKGSWYRAVEAWRHGRIY